MSISEEGSDRPTAFDPKSPASASGNIDFTKYLTLSKAKTLLS
jgi:hypothetical protein